MQPGADAEMVVRQAAAWLGCADVSAYTGHVISIFIKIFCSTISGTKIEGTKMNRIKRRFVYCFVLAGPVVGALIIPEA